MSGTWLVTKWHEWMSEQDSKSQSMKSTHEGYALPESAWTLHLQAVGKDYVVIWVGMGK